MYVLHSFSNGAVQTLGPEQFLGLYLTGGVLSSFASYLYKAAVAQPGLSLGAVRPLFDLILFKTLKPHPISVRSDNGRPSFCLCKVSRYPT